MSFTSLGLSPKLLDAIKTAGFTTPTPIQERAIPLILSGRDVFGSAQTGTGKTASFVIPLLEKLLLHASLATSPAKHPLRALILAPTRELSEQINTTIKKISRGLGIRHCTVYGGVDINKQINMIRLGQEIIVATPGRLLDILSQKLLMTHTLQFLIIDEADLMLDMGFMPDILRILEKLPAERQNLFFSATHNDTIQKLSNKILSSPEWVQVARKNSVSLNVTHTAYRISDDRKRLLLRKLLPPKGEQALIFVDKRDTCSQLSQWLRAQGIGADELHGNKSQQERLKILNGFKTGRTQFLVATDLAARGLDIDELAYVINFTLPNTPENYIHRVGRTGRSNHKGEAISMVCSGEERRLRDIEKLIGSKIKFIELPQMDNTLPMIAPLVLEKEKAIEKMALNNRTRKPRPRVKKKPQLAY